MTFLPPLVLPFFPLVPAAAAFLVGRLFTTATSSSLSDVVGGSLEFAIGVGVGGLEPERKGTCSAVVAGTGDGAGSNAVTDSVKHVVR